MSQLITAKIARIAAHCKAAGIHGVTRNHLIHGTGGSPRRAIRAIKYGTAEFLADLYAAVWADTQSHVKATAACDKAWDELMAGEFDDDGEAVADTEPSEAAAELAASGEASADTPQAADAAVSAAKLAKRLRKYAKAIGATFDSTELSAFAALPTLGDALRAMDEAAKAKAD